MVVSALGQEKCKCVMEYGIHLKFFVRFYSLCVVLRVFCPCGLVRQAIKCIFNGVRIGVDRVDITNLY